MRIAANAYKEYGGRFFHNDTTTISIQGEYEHEKGDLDAISIEITHGTPRTAETGPEAVRYFFGYV